MKKKYIFHSSNFDKELLRKRIILLNDNSIDYKIITQSNKTHFRAPLSGYFEAEIHVLEKDFEKADQLLTSLIG